MGVQLWLRLVYRVGGAVVVQVGILGCGFRCGSGVVQVWFRLVYWVGGSGVVKVGV